MRRSSMRVAMIAIASVALTVPGLVSAADHLDGPAVSANGAIDINDVYAFEGAEGNTVLAITVNPAAGMISGTTFDPSAEYVLNIDTDGDAAADLDYTVTFEADAGGVQTYTVTSGGEMVVEGMTGANVSIESGGQVFAGLVDDPFFFDLDGFKQLKQTLLDGGDAATAISKICDTDPDTNFFAGFNASTIVLEVPDDALGGEIGVWATTMVDGSQIDRMGKPGINTVFITGDDAKDGFNAADVANDPDEYTDEVVGITSAIQQALGVAEADANAYGEAVAGMLLPDVLPYNTAEAADFSVFNGRALTDDIIDVEYSVLTTVDEEPQLTGDCVANDSQFRSEFPYLATANAGGTAGGPGQMPGTSVEAPTTGTLPALGILFGLAGLLLIGSLALVTVNVRRSRS